MDDRDENNILPLNKYISSLINDRENSDVILDSGHYDSTEVIIENVEWKNKEINFRMAPLSENRIIIGDRSYIKFVCRAMKSDDSAITDTTIEMRDGLGDILVQSVQLQLSGYNAHSDSTAPRTSHMYNHINYPNSARGMNQFVMNYVHGEKDSFPVGADIKQIGGYANTSILNNKKFSVTRDLNEVAFMGPRDTVIPGALPISIKIHLTNNPASCFNCASSVIASPKLYISTVCLKIYSVMISEAMSAQITRALVTEKLTGTFDSWHTTGNGEILPNNDTYTGNSITIETIPDFFGIVFEPVAASSSTAYKGRHVLTTTWNNIDFIDIFRGGTPIRRYTLTEKSDMMKELEQLTGGNTQAGYGGISPIDNTVFAAGHLSFFPVVNRAISDSTVLDPRINIIKFVATMNSNQSVAGKSYIVYKVRHQLQYSLTPGKTQIIK